MPASSGGSFAVRGEFGYWVFEGDWQPSQRPSWNYRKSEGGGIILDMLCHWRYVLDNLFGKVQSVSCLGATHIPKRGTRTDEPYDADADDAAYATFQLAGGVVAHINSSWCTRVRRDDLVTFHVDGTHGSAVAGLTESWSQARVNTPRPVWNPDVPQTIGSSRPGGGVGTTSTRTASSCRSGKISFAMWRGRRQVDHVEGAKGVQLAELGLQKLERAALGRHARPQGLNRGSLYPGGHNRKSKEEGPAHRLRRRRQARTPTPPAAARVSSRQATVQLNAYAAAHLWPPIRRRPRPGPRCRHRLGGHHGNSAGTYGRLDLGVAEAREPPARHGHGLAGPLWS